MPPQQPVALPYSSAIAARGETPFASAWPWGRWVEVIQSVWLRCVADADGDGLLPLVLVQRAGNLALQEEVVDALLEAADQQHAAVERQRVLRLQPA